MEEMQNTRAPRNQLMVILLSRPCMACTTFLLIVAAIGVYTVRQYLPVVGTIVLLELGIVPGVGVVWVVVALVKWIHKEEHIEIGPSGTIGRRFNTVREYHPLGIKEHHASAPREKKAVSAVVIPSLKDIAQTLGGGTLLLGYRADGTPRFGDWNEIRTFAVAGKSGAGKTVTMVVLIVQALLEGAQVWICDPHYNKPSGLTKVLTPLLPFVRLARTDKEIVAMAEDYYIEMENRLVSGDTETMTPILFVVDEWTRLISRRTKEEKDTLKKVVLGCEQEYRGVQGFAMIAGQSWTAQDSGGTEIRRGMHAVFVHRLNEEYGKFLLEGRQGKKALKDVPHLKPGMLFLQDTDGDVEQLYMPYYGDDREGIYAIAEIMQALTGGEGETAKLYLPEPPAPPAQSTPVNSVNDSGNSKQTVNSDVNKPVEQSDTPLLQVYQLPNTENVLEIAEMTNETLSVNERINTNEIIVRMYASGIPLRTIAKIVKLDGRKYTPVFKPLCVELGIDIKE